ncbi:HNH endonuclease signature motif containing protein [Streptomyces tendae]|uniref:HNH endonuclease signature motif containing protein n=1 Tax=Streptomyces tendae TaxID=1932 RepID=UPI0036AFC801
MRDFPGYYVTDDGRVWSAKGRGRWLKGSPNPGGYLIVGLYRAGKERRWRIHSLVAEVFYGPRPAGLDVCHNNGDRTDNRASNLRYGTRAENARDSVTHGTHRNARKTHCPAGHPLEGDNLVTRPGRNLRQCRACNRVRVRIRDHRTRKGINFRVRLGVDPFRDEPAGRV